MGFDVREFGAVGDGVAADTAAVQNAIDACAAAGGGTVLFPPGDYLCGTIELRSDVLLEIAHAATVHGSGKITDYGEPQNGGYDEIRYALFTAREAHTIGVVGHGTIHCHGSEFSPDARPRGMLFEQCTGIELRDVTLRDAGSWMVHVFRCTNVNIAGVIIRSRVQMNNDAVDIDSSSGVRITNCDIECGDDAIALKSRAAEPTSNVVVSNCLIKTDWAAFRFGPESLGGFTDISVTNCVIRETWGTGIKLQMTQGSVMSRIVFSNLVMHQVTGPISIRLSGWTEGPYAPTTNDHWQEGVLEDVTFSGITATVPNYTKRRDMNWDDERFSAITITGLPELRVRDLTFSDIRIRYPGGGTSEQAARTVLPDLPQSYPEYLMFGVPPAYALYMAHADRITVRNVAFALEAEDARPAVILNDCTDVGFVDSRFEASERADSVVRLHESTDVAFRDTVFPAGFDEPVRTV